MAVVAKLKVTILNTKINLSHSAKTKYDTCGEMYRLHYLEKIRPEAHGIALIFGNALDNALNELVKPTGKIPEDIFEKEFTTAKIAGTDCYIPTYTKVTYPNSNFDREILVSEDFEEVREHIAKGKINWPVLTPEEQLETFDTLREKKRAAQGFVGFTEDEMKFYNLLNWRCMRRKGILMIEAYQDHIMPLLEEVLASQERIVLLNDEGDIIRGVVDLVAKVKGFGPVILDNKTSTIKYTDNAVLESEQLGLYVHCLQDVYNTTKAGFIVLNKNIKKNRIKICQKCGHDGTNGRARTCDTEIQGKRCHGKWTETVDPEIEVTMFIDDIPEERQLEVIEKFDTTNQLIKSGVFEKNLKSCDNQYGRRCDYYDLCHSNSMDGLVDLKTKDKTNE